MAYQLSESGSDWKTIKVKAIDHNGKPSDLPDVCEYVRFSGIAWTLDGEGFFYSRCSQLHASCHGDICARLVHTNLDLTSGFTYALQSIFYFL
jgi:hypothetical protein